MVLFFTTQKKKKQLRKVALQHFHIWIDRGTTIDIPEDEWLKVKLQAGVESNAARVLPLAYETVK